MQEIFKKGERFQRRKTGIGRAIFVSAFFYVVGTLQRTEDGNRYIVVAIDATSTWSEARYLKKKSAEAVAKFFL